MIDSGITKRYFNWMLELVDYDFHPTEDYLSLFDFLNNIEFVFVNPMDSNRYEDGLDLRNTFGYFNNVDIQDIVDEFSDDPCSVLEMLVALAYKCEKDIMEDYQLGSRINEWFWIFLENLGLDEFDDDSFDEEKVKDILYKWMERRYKSNGEGNIIKFDCRYDMRVLDIWYQVNLYFTMMEIK